MPEISVIVPAYNAELTIVETIESVLQQTFQNFEIIVINDGSQDRTQTLVEAISDPRVQVISYPNGGVCAARNRGISLAKKAIRLHPQFSSMTIADRSSPG